MPIIYGKYSIPFKRYTTQQLGFEDHFTEDVTIHLVQDCAHIFFIPCFGMGKDYFYRKDGVHHPLPHELVLRLHEQENIRTPVFAYILPLLILLLSVGLIVNSIFRGNSRTQFQKKQFTARLAENEYALEHLNEHHYIQLENPRDYGSPTVYLHIEHVRDQDIECRVLQSRDSGLEQPYKLAQRFQSLGQSLPTVTISRKDLNAAISKNFARYKKKYRPAIQLLNDSNPYFVESITYIYGPVLDASYAWNLKSPKDIEIFLENVGFGATLTRIESKDAEIAWSTPVPQFVPGGYSKENHLSIRGTSSTHLSRYSITLSMQDSLGNQHTFSVLATGKETLIQRKY